MFTGDGHQGNSEIIVIDTNGTPITFNACLDTKLFRLGSHDTRKQGFKAVNALRKYDSEQFKWTSDATDLLINIRLKMNDEFKNSTRKQSDLWEKVSQLMKEIGDFTVLSNICHNKFRNLLITYKANKRKHSMLGNKSIKWEFFDVIDSIFKDEETIYPKKRKSKTLEENVSEDEDVKMQHTLPCRDTTCEIENNFYWSSDAIKLLLVIRLEMQDEFLKSNCQKKQLWEGISQQMNEIGNYFISAEMCHSKYRNLLATYRVNKKRQSDYGEGAVKWEYFSMIDNALDPQKSHISLNNACEEVLKDKPDISDETNFSETENQICQEDVENRSDEGDVIKNEVPSDVPFLKHLKFQGNTEKKEAESNVDEKTWLEQKELTLKKIEALNNLAASISENNLIWQEKKELKLKQIEAMNNLAIAIVGKRNM